MKKTFKSMSALAILSAMSLQAPMALATEAAPELNQGEPGVVLESNDVDKVLNEKKSEITEKLGSEEGKESTDEGGKESTDEDKESTDEKQKSKDEKDKSKNEGVDEKTAIALPEGSQVVVDHAVAETVLADMGISEKVTHTVYDVADLSPDSLKAYMDEKTADLTEGAVSNEYIALVSMTVDSVPQVRIAEIVPDNSVSETVTVLNPEVTDFTDVETVDSFDRGYILRTITTYTMTEDGVDEVVEEVNEVIKETTYATVRRIAKEDTVGDKDKKTGKEVDNKKADKEVDDKKADKEADDKKTGKEADDKKADEKDGEKADDKTDKVAVEKTESKEEVKSDNKALPETGEVLGLGAIASAVASLFAGLGLVRRKKD